MNEAEKTIRQYVLRSAGNCNYITDYTMSCFVGMIETGEATATDFDRAFDGLGAKVLAFKAKLDAEREGK